MLRSLRNQTKSIFFKCFLILLICGFALWGVGDLTGGIKQKSILSVKNNEITAEQIINELNRLRYGLPERPSLVDTLKNGMLQNTLNKYEQQILINTEAEEIDLKVPLKIKTLTISKEKAFKDPIGNFSQTKFVQSLNNVGLTEKKYLEMLVTEANYKQISMPFSYNDIYSNKIVKDIIDWQNEIRDITYNTLDYIDEKQIRLPSKEELKKFYDENKNNYKIPITRDINFIEIKPKYFENEVDIKDKDIKVRYENDKHEYIKKEKRKLYQFTTDDINKANIFKNLVSKGNDFKTVAKENYKLTLEDIDIGFLTKSELPLKNADVIFNANLGEIVGPLKTDFGYKLYKIIKVKPKKEPTYQDVYNDLRKKIYKEESIEIMYQKIDSIEDMIAEGSSLEEIAKSERLGKNISIQEISNLSQNGVIYSFNGKNSYLNKDNLFLKTTFNTPLNEISDLITLEDDTFALIYISKQNKEEIPDFKKINQIVDKEWKQNEITFQTKLELEKLILQNNNKLTNKTSIKRNEKSLNKIIEPQIIPRIFNINNKDINFFKMNGSMIAIKIKDSKIGKYKLDNKLNNDLNISLSKSFYNDFSNFYINNLANKYKLERNYNDLEKLIKNSQFN